MPKRLVEDQAQRIIAKKSDEELNKRLESIHAASQGTTDEVKNLRKEIANLKKQLADQHKESGTIISSAATEVKKATNYASQLNKVLSFSVKTAEEGQKNLEVKFTRLTRAIFGITRKEVKKYGPEVFQEKILAKTMLQTWGTEISKQFGMSIESFGNILGLEFTPLRELLGIIKSFYNSFINIRNILIKGGYILTTFLRGTWVEKIFGKTFVKLQNLFAKGVMRITTAEERREMYTRAFDNTIRKLIQEAQTPEGKEIIRKEFTRIPGFGTKFTALPEEIQQQIVDTYVKQLRTAYLQYEDAFVPFMKQVGRSTAKVILEFEDVLGKHEHILLTSARLIEDEQKLVEQAANTTEKVTKAAERIKEKVEKVKESEPEVKTKEIQTKKDLRTISKLTGKEINTMLREHPITHFTGRILSILVKIFAFLKGKAILDLFKKIWGGIGRGIGTVARAGMGLIRGTPATYAGEALIVARGIGGALNRILPTEIKQSLLQTKIGGIIAKAIGITPEDTEEIKQEFEKTGPQLKTKVFNAIGNIAAGIGESILKLPFEISKFVGKLTFKPLASLLRNLGLNTIARWFEVAYNNLDWTFKQIYTGIRIVTNWVGKLLMLPFDLVIQGIKKLGRFFEGVNEEILKLRAKLGDPYAREVIRRARIIQRAHNIAENILQASVTSYSKRFQSLTEQQKEALKKNLEETAKVLLEQGTSIEKTQSVLEKVVDNFMEKQFGRIRKISDTSTILNKKLQEGTDSLSKQFQALQEAVNIPGLEGVIDKYKDFILKTFNLKMPTTTAIPKTGLEGVKLSAKEMAAIENTKTISDAMNNIKIEVPKQEQPQLAKIGETVPSGESKMPADTAMAMFKFLMGA